MPYDARDPRAQLTRSASSATPSGACFPPQYFEFPKLEPDEVSAAGTKSWSVRSQTCCIGVLARPPRRHAAARRSTGRVHGAAPVGRLRRQRSRRQRRRRGRRQRRRRRAPGRSDDRRRVRRRGRPRLHDPEPRTSSRRCRNADVYSRARPERRPVRAVAGPARRPSRQGVPARRHQAGAGPLRPDPALQHDHGQLLLRRRRTARPAHHVAPPPRRLRAALATAGGRLRPPHPHARGPWT